MSKYVDADELLKEAYKDGAYGYVSSQEIKDFPAADVVEVRHGWWEHLGGDEWFCTACGHVITTEGSWERPWQKYCEECGAKMDLEGDAE